MTMTDSSIQDAAAALRKARAERTPIAPISTTHNISGVDAAYEVAAINTRAHKESGARIVGKKIGLTSQAVREQLGVDQPDFGILFDDMEYLDGSEVPFSRLMQPKAEAEVAFIMAYDLAGHSPSWAEFVNAIAYALPAIEVVDSAITDWKLMLEDTVADNASCGLYVLGNQPVGIDHIALADVEMHVEKNGAVASTGVGSACMGHPLRAAYWLAKMMIERGEGLKTGEVILSGALGPMVDVKAGDAVEAHIGALGSVSCRFV